MKRVCIFCFYNEGGIVDQATKVLLKELKKNVDSIIFVSNGTLIQGDIGLLCDIVVQRENEGFDAAAYKMILEDATYNQYLDQADELVLCNSSFFGPFIPIHDIFEKMEELGSDIWGITSCEKNLANHIQSYFIVFRKHVFDSLVFKNYFKDHIRDNYTYKEVCAAFENGLFHVLIENGFTYSAYVNDINYDLYKNPYGSIQCDAVPILKKKVFEKERSFNVENALRVIQERYKYDIDIIKQYANDRYGYQIDDKKMIEEYPAYIQKDLVQNIQVSRAHIQRFIDDNEGVYIYGTGGTGFLVYSAFFYYPDNEKLKGFVVSDDMYNEEKLYGYSIYKLSEIEEDNMAIIIALTEANTESVIHNLNGHKIISLW